MKLHALHSTLLLWLLSVLRGGVAYPTSQVKWNYSLPPNRTVLDRNNEVFNTVDNVKLKFAQSDLSASPDYLKYFWDVSSLKRFANSIMGKVESTGMCISCKFAVAFLQYNVRNGATEDDIASIAKRICSSFRLEKPRVCAGLASLFKRQVTQVLANIALKPDEFCGVVIGGGCGVVVNPLNNWTVPMTPFPKPPVKPIPAPKPGSPTLRVLHLSDTHLDPYYKEGTNADCGEPLCCRASSGKPATPADAAGIWGDYRNCDVSLRLLENLLDHLNKSQKFDYVIWTGDIPPHDIWNTSRKEASYLLHSVSGLMKKYLGNVPIFPALGNHESSPVNSFPIPQVKGNDSITWLYQEVVKAWTPWLPPNSISTLELGAYYSLLVQPGFRIISLNMNYCNNLNWWLLLNSTDPTGELEWLVYELQMAENKGEKVHIIGHIPPGEFDCLSVWSANYYKIINRYESTVTAQFFGHTHKDEYEIFYDKSHGKRRPSNIVYVGPSVTTYDGVNPGYRIYTIDGNYSGSSRVVLDHETYFMNLTEANAYGTPHWRFEYSARKAFNMSSLLPYDWDLLTSRFKHDDKLFQKFYRYYNKMSDYHNQVCENECKAELLCKLRRGQSNDPVVC